MKKWRTYVSDCRVLIEFIEVDSERPRSLCHPNERYWDDAQTAFDYWEPEYEKFWAQLGVDVKI